MNITKRIAYVVLLSLLLAFTIRADDSDNKDEENDDEDASDPKYRSENVMKFTAPEVNDEEAHSHRLPSNLICDGCKAIAHQLGTAIKSIHDLKYRKQKVKAPESEIIEVVENTCHRKTFESYGLKHVNGVNRLSGPGTDVEDEPGLLQGGGRWPHRLSMFCEELVGATEEYELYSRVLRRGPHRLHLFLCANTSEKALNSCNANPPRDEL